MSAIPDKGTRTRQRHYGSADSILEQMAANDVATSFYSAFVDYLQSEKPNIKQSKKALKSLMSRDFNLKFSGTPGLVSNAYGEANQPIKNDGTGDPLYGDDFPSGRTNAMQRFKALRKEITTDSVEVDFIIGGDLGTSLTITDPVTWANEPMTDRVVILSDHYATAKNTNNDFRLDVASFFTVGDNDKVNDFEMRFDSYVMSQAMSGMEPLIANPDMDEAMEGYRDNSVTTDQTINGTFTFFGTFAQAAPPDPDNLDVIEPVLTDNVRVKFQGDPNFQLSARNTIGEGKDEYLAVQKGSWVQSISEVFTMEEIYALDDISVANYKEQRITSGPGFTEAGYGQSLGNRFVMDAAIITYIHNNEDDPNLPQLTASTEGLFDTEQIVQATYGSAPFPIATQDYVGPLTSFC